MNQETPPPVASRNGDSLSVITTVKQKDPKRVEMGKKLAAMSEAARERKKQLALASSADEARAESWNINYDRLIGLAGIIIAVYATRVQLRAGANQ